MGDQDAYGPLDVANGPEVRMLLQCWDLRLTVSLQTSFVENQKKQDQEKQERHAKRAAELSNALEHATRKVQIAEGEVERLQGLLDDGLLQEGGAASDLTS